MQNRNKSLFAHQLLFERREEEIEEVEITE